MTEREIEAYKAVFQNPALPEKEHEAWVKRLYSSAGDAHKMVVVEEMILRINASKASEEDKTLVIGTLDPNWKESRTVAVIASSAGAGMYAITAAWRAVWSKCRKLISEAGRPRTIARLSGTQQNKPTEGMVRRAVNQIVGSAGVNSAVRGAIQEGMRIDWKQTRDLALFAMATV